MAEQKYYAYNISNEGSPVEEPDLDRLGRLDNQVRFEITTMLRDTNGASYHNDMYVPFMNQRQPAQDLATNQSNTTVQPAQKQDQGNTVQPAQDENNPLQPDVGVDDDDDDDDPSFDGMDEETGYMSFAKHLRADMKKNKNAPDIENEGLFPALGNGNSRREEPGGSLLVEEGTEGNIVSVRHKMNF
ncbi:uncharacterized protein LOC113365648 [Ctenocephalides felis]|uniref:uncharacterized protein LOC113365648 n=1 Tax=Ctenocephalides felis TaxID=7515 RepID=UPI000E6E2DC9|nr:uncharacterized protein LOC113365648 [Ctenocephalides felis]